MTILGLMDAVRDGIEALAATPLSTFEAYVTTPTSRRNISDEAVFIDVAEGGAEEANIGISAGVGRYEVRVPLEITATWRAEDTDTDRDRAFAVLEQLQKFVRDNRDLSAGGELARFGQWSNAYPGYTTEGRDDDAMTLRAVRLTATWTIPQDT